MTTDNKKDKSVKRVLFIAHDDKFVKHFLVEHKRTFETLGYEVIYAVNNKYGSFDNDPNTTILNIDIQQSPFKLIKNFKALRQVSKYIKQENISVIYAHTPVGGVIGRLAKVFDRSLTTIYLPHGYHFLKGSSWSSWMMYYPVEKLLSYLTNLTITINREDYNVTRKRMNKKLDVELINGVGVNIHHKNIKPNIRKEDEVFNITHVAELNENKNQMCLLRALKLIADRAKTNNDIPVFKTYFIGEGKNLDNLEKYVEDHDLSQYVEFLGYINNVKDYLRVSHCAISCSKREGLPVNLIESLSYGIPIVATNCRGNRDVVQNGINGYITKFNDEKELANKIISIMLESDEYIENFYENNIMKSNIYSVEVVNKQLSTILKRVLKIDNEGVQS